MLLANGVGAAFLFGGILVGLLSVAVAVVIETPILWLWWRRTNLWRWVLAANAASLVGGLLPAFVLNALPGPAGSVDPWQWYATAWLDVLRFCGVVFLVTVVVEGLVYARMHRKDASQV